MLNKVKTSELTGAALDWAVAKCEGYTKHTPHEFLASQRMFGKHKWSFAWVLGGPIIERERISTEDNGQGYWNARIYRMHPTTGDTPLIAAMRCYVASKLGDTVNIPKELM